MDFRERSRTHFCRESLLLLYNTRISPILQVAYQRILQLSYVDDLLAALRTLFVKMFEPFLAAFVASLHAVSSAKIATFGPVEQWNFASAFKDWDNVFDKLLHGLESKAAQVRPFPA